ncbi:MAG: DUF6755 family protein [Fimbriimonadaceae bacterium]
MPNLAQKRQKSAVFVALLLFNLVLVLLQLWLFVSVLEGLIAGKGAMAIPAAIASAVLFFVNVWMLRGLQRLD